MFIYLLSLFSYFTFITSVMLLCSKKKGKPFSKGIISIKVPPNNRTSAREGRLRHDHPTEEKKEETKKGKTDPEPNNSKESHKAEEAKQSGNSAIQSKEKSKNVEVFKVQSDASEQKRTLDDANSDWGGNVMKKLDNTETTKKYVGEEEGKKKKDNDEPKKETSKEKGKNEEPKKETSKEKGKNDEAKKKEETKKEPVKIGKFTAKKEQMKIAEKSIKATVEDLDGRTVEIFN